MVFKIQDINLIHLSFPKGCKIIQFLPRYFYNWTWGFRPESDIIESYGYYMVNKNELPPKKWSSRIINFSSADVDL